MKGWWNVAFIFVELRLLYVRVSENGVPVNLSVHIFSVKIAIWAVCNNFGRIHMFMCAFLPQGDATVR
jgi:hypothetical protein